MPSHKFSVLTFFPTHKKESIEANPYRLFINYVLMDLYFSCYLFWATRSNPVIVILKKKRNLSIQTQLSYLGCTEIFFTNKIKIFINYFLSDFSFYG